MPRKTAAEKAAEKEQADKSAAEKAEAEKKADDEKAAAEKAAAKKSKVKLVELADKDTGFNDRETGFKIVRRQQKPLGENIGTATQQALVSGRLLIVE